MDEIEEDEGSNQDTKRTEKEDEDEINLKEVHFDVLNNGLARSKVNDKTLKAYVKV